LPAAASRNTSEDDDAAYAPATATVTKQTATPAVTVRLGLTGELLAAAYMAVFFLDHHGDRPASADLLPAATGGHPALALAAGTLAPVARLDVPPAAPDVLPPAEHESLPAEEPAGAAATQDANSYPTEDPAPPSPRTGEPLAFQLPANLDALAASADRFFARLEQLAGGSDDAPAARLARLLLTTVVVTGAVEGLRWLGGRLRVKPALPEDAWAPPLPEAEAP
jgi:hypothetical protein